MLQQGVPVCKPGAGKMKVSESWGEACSWCVHSQIEACMGVHARLEVCTQAKP